MPRRSSTTAKEKPAAPKSTGLTVPMYSLDGKTSGNVELPKEVFGSKVNNQVLSQAVRVYLNNQKSHNSHTKTRGEVKGSTRKLGSQKGSGHARHGSIKAPIFVGGGIALGPRSRVVRLELPKKMKKAALISALSSKATAGEVLGLANAEAVTGKTKQISAFLKALDKKSVLVITDERKENVLRSIRNIQGADVTSVDQLNAFEVVAHQTLVVTKDALTKLGETK